MNQDDKKRAVAEAALKFVEPDTVVGVGTGSTANFFIDGLARLRLRGAVASSEASAKRLAGHGIRLLRLDEAGEIPVYVDGADEATRDGYLIKGGGGALTREKIVAEFSRTFVCIVDDSKIVERLGAFPLPVEVVPMALPLVARRAESLGARPVLREGFTTDNGNAILDLHGLTIEDPIGLERTLDRIPGVVTNGLFCRRPADKLLIATSEGVREI